MASSIQNNRETPSGHCFYCHLCRMWLWRVCKWFPVFIIVSIISWSYYAYVVQLCFFTLENTIQRIAYLVLYHILLILFFWSYWQTTFTVLQPVPDKFKLPESELEKLLTAESEDTQRGILENYAKDLPISTRIKITMTKLAQKIGVAQPAQMKEILNKFGQKLPVLIRTASGSVRYCNRCVLIKPDRAHHCSICQRCVLKMDHHCPWVNNCVCFNNYKFFVLFLGYALLYCMFIMVTCLPYFIKFWKNDFGLALVGPGRYHIVFAFFVALMFAISLGSLFGYHCYLVAHNRTTLEAFRAPMFRGGADKNGFSLGAYNNFKEVFGNKPILWLLPVFSSLGDGCEFPVKHEHQLQTFTSQEPHGYESMGTTHSSFGDGIIYPLPRPEEDTESLLNSERWDRWADREAPFDERESSSLDEL